MASSPILEACLLRPFNSSSDQASFLRLAFVQGSYPSIMGACLEVYQRPSTDLASIDKHVAPLELLPFDITSSDLEVLTFIETSAELSSLSIILFKLFVAAF